MIATPTMHGTSSIEGYAYRGIGLAQLNILRQQMALGGLSMGTRRVTLDNGVEILCSKNFNYENVQIIVPVKQGDNQRKFKFYGLFSTTPQKFSYEQVFDQEGNPILDKNEEPVYRLITYAVRDDNKGIIVDVYRFENVPYYYTTSDCKSGNVYWFAKDNSVLSWWGNPSLNIELDNTTLLDNIQYEDPHNNPYSVITYYTALRPNVYCNRNVIYSTKTVKHLYYNDNNELVNTNSGQFEDLVLGSAIYDKKIVAICRRRMHEEAKFEIVVRMQGYHGNIFTDKDNNKYIDYEVITKTYGTRNRNVFWFNEDGSEAVSFEAGRKIKVTLTGEKGEYHASIKINEYPETKNTLVTKQINEHNNNDSDRPYWHCSYLGYEAKCPGVIPIKTAELTEDIMAKIYDLLNYKNTNYNRIGIEITNSVLDNVIGSAYCDKKETDITVSININNLASSLTKTVEKEYIEVPIIGDREIVSYWPLYSMISIGDMLEFVWDNGGDDIGITGVGFTVVAIGYNYKNIIITSICNTNPTINIFSIKYPCIGFKYQPTSNVATLALIYNSTHPFVKAGSFYIIGGNPPFTYSSEHTSGTTYSRGIDISCVAGSKGYGIMTVEDVCGNKTSLSYRFLGNLVPISAVVVNYHGGNYNNCPNGNCRNCSGPLSIWTATKKEPLLPGMDPCSQGGWPNDGSVLSASYIYYGGMSAPKSCTCTSMGDGLPAGISAVCRADAGCGTDCPYYCITGIQTILYEWRC